MTSTDRLIEAILHEDLIKLRIEVDELREIYGQNNPPKLSPIGGKNMNPYHVLANNYEKIGNRQLVENIEEDCIATLINNVKDWQPPSSWLKHFSKSYSDEIRQRIVFVLSLREHFDIDELDENGQSPLAIACSNGDVHLCDTLLQCGADPASQYQNKSLLHLSAKLAINEELQFNKEEHRDKFHLGVHRCIYEIFKFYWPGLWTAIKEQSVENVRKLINSWCKVNIEKDSHTLRELSLETGNESIITLILNITPTINLIHKILAGDVEAVKEDLENEHLRRILINLRKLSDRNSPPLYFAIKMLDISLCRILIQHGASPYVNMLDENQIDMPVIFSALDADTSLEMITSLLPDQKHLFQLDNVLYKGETVLQQAVAKNSNDDVIIAIVNAGGPTILCDRNPDDKTVIDTLNTRGKGDLVQNIENIVFRWLTEPAAFVGWREILVIRGYDRLEQVIQNKILSQSDRKFIDDSNLCQKYIKKLFLDIENLEELFHDNLEETFPSKTFHINDIWWHGRSKNDGLSLLHWIVLNKRTDDLKTIINYLFDYEPKKDDHLITKSHSYCIDDVKDQWRRTPLHYAYGTFDGKLLRKMLSSCGASDHTLDMFYKEPLDFRDACGSRELETLLSNIINKNDLHLQNRPWERETLRVQRERQREFRYVHHQYHQHLNSCDSPNPARAFQMTQNNRLLKMTKKRFSNNIYPESLHNHSRYLPSVSESEEFALEGSSLPRHDFQLPRALYELFEEKADLEKSSSFEYNFYQSADSDNEKFLTDEAESPKVFRFCILM